MRVATLLPVVALVILSGGCAAPDDKSAEAREEKVYRTGSNIPQGDRSATAPAKTTSADDLKGQMIPQMPSKSGFGN